MFRARTSTLQKDHRPYLIKKAYLKFQDFYVNHFLKPQFQSLGKGFTFMKPWHVEIFGSPVKIGDYVTVLTTPDCKVRFSVWPEKEGSGFIDIGNYCLFCPGVRIGSGNGITIGDNCMVASHVYITDSDWHDIYNRIDMGRTQPVTIEENVWIGDSAIICKGVTIGKNSIIGAGSVVVDDIPADSIAAGNPAKVVKKLDKNEKITKRSHLFSDPDKLAREIDAFDQAMLKGNTIFHWLRHMFFPFRGE